MDHETATKAAAEKRLAVAMNLRERSPAGTARFWVRGFRASSRASANRLKDIAAVLAKTTARATFPSTSRGGRPGVAKKAAATAKGRAKTECEILMASR